MMKLFLRTVIIAISLLCIPVLSWAYSPDIEDGVSWLLGSQNIDGSWGNNTDRVILDTSSVIESLRYLDNGGPAYLAGINWLNTQLPLNTDFLSRKITNLHWAGIDVTADVTTLLNSRRTDSGWGGDADASSMVNDTVFALQALKAVNYADQAVISGAIKYLLPAQNADGGFGFCSSVSVGCSDSDSNAYMTAIVLQTLAQFKTTYDLQAQITSAVAYILTKQNIDKGFGSGGASATPTTSTTYETALAVMALIKGNTGQGSAQPLQIPIQNAIAYLTATQQVNGSWDDDPYSTALALRALSMVKPNLSISSSDITFSNPVPTTGDTLTITATVHNTGPSQAPSTGSGQAGITVQIYDGDPSSGGILIGETAIASIPAYGSRSCFHHLDHTVSGSTYHLCCC